jgi:nucleoside-diphosphate-sugar epimerase
MRKVLVIGADGYIGKRLTKHLSQSGVSVVAMVPEFCYDNFSQQFPSIYCEKLDFPNLLETDYTSFLTDVDTIYNLAWAGVNAKDRNNVNIQPANFVYNIKVVQLAEKYQIKKLIIPGSAAEFSCSGNIIDGKGVSSPSDLYSATKAATREFCSVFCKQYSIELIWTLITSIYGPGRDDNNLISYVIKSLLKNEKPSCTKLEQKWDYIFIDDLINALTLVGEKGIGGKIYPVGSGEHRSLHDYVEIIHKLINPTIPIGIGDIPYKSSHIDNQIMDITDLVNDTGFVPLFSFEEGIKSVIDYYKTIMQ